MSRAALGVHHYGTFIDHANRMRRLESLGTSHSIECLLMTDGYAHDEITPATYLAFTIGKKQYLVVTFLCVY